MSSTYSIEVLKIVIGQICQTIGWHSIQSTALDIMVDILHRYITELGKKSHSYAEHFGHTTPNLDEIALAFRDVGIRVEDLSEYIQNVESVPFPHEVPKYPISGETHLNFLKPGSREVLTRPVHVHEHLPPMRPDMEGMPNLCPVESIGLRSSEVNPTVLKLVVEKREEQAVIRRQRCPRLCDPVYTRLTRSKKRLLYMHTV